VFLVSYFDLKTPGVATRVDGLELGRWSRTLWRDYRPRQLV